MVDVALNILAGALWLFILPMAIIRIMESRSFEYKLMRTPKGLTFSYRLGVYAGNIEMVRDSEVFMPSISQGVHGWVCKFPTDYSLKEMCLYVRSFTVRAMEVTSHSKDLLVFDEVVNKKNDSLVAINGGIYTYDNPDHRPYQTY